MSQEWKAKVKQAWEATLNQGNFNAFDELVAPTHIRHQPPFPDLVGREAIKTYLADVRASYPDCHFTVNQILVEGEWDAIHWTLEGTHTGLSPTTGTPPTGKHIVMHGCSMERYEGGQAVESWVHADFLGLLQQLGVIPLRA